MRAEITRAQLGKAIQILRKIQEQKRLRFGHYPASGNRVKKMRFSRLNLELEPVPGFRLSGPTATPADQIVGPGPQIKVCLTALWLGPIDQGPEGV
jgi:hypothetical protein